MRLYGLVGFPLGHSFSKKYFTEKFENEGLTDCRFQLFAIENIQQFSNLIAINKELSGLAVTIPYKESIVPFLTQLHETAAEVGAVNCIQFTKKGLIGYNTDAIGFEQSFMPLVAGIQAKNALVLGTGGASKAIQFVLKKNNIRYTIVSRQQSNNSIIYADIDRSMLESHNIIINCTPLGMTPNEAGMPPLPYDFLTPQHFLYDVVYKPSTTRFLQQGISANCRVKNGFEMLILQAEQNWRIWNSVD